MCEDLHPPNYHHLDDRKDEEISLKTMKKIFTIIPDENEAEFVRGKEEGEA